MGAIEIPPGEPQHRNKQVKWEVGSSLTRNKAFESQQSPLLLRRPVAPHGIGNLDLRILSLPGAEKTVRGLSKVSMVIIDEALEPIREVWIHDEAFAASRLSMMRIMARRMKAATVLA